MAKQRIASLVARPSVTGRHSRPSEEGTGAARLVRRVLRDRRGATALAFAIGGTVLIGAAALATEGGLIYLTRQNAQNAADAAGIAAASALNYRGRTPAIAAAQEVAGRNGFTNAGLTQVLVNNPPTSGRWTQDKTAFEVVVRRTLDTALGSAFLGPTVQVSARSVVRLQGTSLRACLLALTGTVTIQNSSSFNAPNCVVGSNLPGVASINIPQSNSSVTAKTMVTVGTCSGCNMSRVHLSQTYQEHAPPIGNPYAFLDDKVQPTYSQTSCMYPSTLEINAQYNNFSSLKPSGTQKYYCYDVVVHNMGPPPPIPSGTYVFYNSSLTIQNISSISCSGCTFIFIGPNAGTINLNNTSSVNMTASAANNDDADYDGILFYRNATGTTGSSSSPTLALQQASSFFLAGGIYYPQAYVKFTNISSNTASTCQAVVAGTIEIASLSAYSFDVSGCATYGTPVATTQVPQIVE